MWNAKFISALTAALLFAGPQACWAQAKPNHSATTTTAAKSAGKAAIDWKWVAGDADVDAAFAQAARLKKPVFLYWGAVWCPPCNQVKATLFSRPDFIERSKAFVAVYVDGDKPGAQKVAARFKVRGYPTMILFKADGSEITRLPGEVDAERYMQTLTLGLDAQVSVRELIARSRKQQPLSADQWRLLAHYSFDTDEQQVVASAELPAVLAATASAAPAVQADVAARLRLKALAAQAGASGKPSEAEAQAARQHVERIAAQSTLADQVADLYAAYAGDWLKAFGPPGASSTSAAISQVLQRQIAGGARSNGERLDALIARVAVWKHEGGGKLSAEQQKTVAQTAQALAAATPDKYERQTVVPSAAYALAQAELLSDSTALLQAELPKAVAPYYHMQMLGSNAKKAGDAKAAVDWYEQAWRKSEGPATRLQWGVGYVGQLLELQPTDLERIRTAVTSVLKELPPTGETFYERNQRSIQRLAQRLDAWRGTEAARAQLIAAAQKQVQDLCTQLPARDPGRANCEKSMTAL